MASVFLRLNVRTFVFGRFIIEFVLNGIMMLVGIAFAFTVSEILDILIAFNREFEADSR